MGAALVALSLIPECYRFTIDMEMALGIANIAAGVHIIEASWQTFGAVVISCSARIATRSNPMNVLSTQADANSTLMNTNTFIWNRG